MLVKISRLKAIRHEASLIRSEKVMQSVYHLEYFATTYQLTWSTSLGTPKFWHAPCCVQNTMKWWIMLLNESEICIPLYLYLILYDNAFYYAAQDTNKLNSDMPILDSLQQYKVMNDWGSHKYSVTREKVVTCYLCWNVRQFSGKTYFESPLSRSEF